MIVTNKDSIREVILFPQLKLKEEDEWKELHLEWDQLVNYILEITLVL
jgi:hypothetical protein